MKKGRKGGCLPWALLGQSRHFSPLPPGERPGPPTLALPTTLLLSRSTASRALTLEPSQVVVCNPGNKPLDLSPPGQEHTLIPLARKALPLCTINSFLKGLPLHIGGSHPSSMASLLSVCLMLTLITVVWPHSSYTRLPQSLPTMGRNNCPPAWALVRGSQHP